MEDTTAFQKTNTKLSGDFLQSPFWCTFQESAGRKSFELSGRGFRGFGFVHTLSGLGKYLYFPHGPVVEMDVLSREELTEELERAGKAAHTCFVRVEPKNEAEKKIYQELYGTRLVKAPRAVQPEETFVIDI